ncbi:hypothetical protein J7T55_014352 [Diaporthe amygdali]|uniref:uncharacterized protein n=1 Tax=Phomopsis amygdali TaxID=1214568 RepID=UPI0022FE13AB|nr:uncharacterized protein J7T55_014352 [Diaporthe amygdali]KAJ0117902.1 hypothetical protein J7T55_014352 [Diaporthe amygdali]
MTASSFALPEDFGSVEDYFHARESFINAERALGYESKVKRSDLEARAQEIVHKLKKWEEDNHHGTRTDGSGCEAGHRFLHGLEAIENSQIFKIAQKAPKGSLLHCHFDCILPPRTMLDDAKKQDKLHIKSDCPLTTKGFFACALPQFCILPNHVDLSETTNLFSKAYIAGSWMRYSDFLRLFPGGWERAEAWLSKQILITSDDAYHPQQTVDGIWREFMRGVMIQRSMLCYETAYKGQFRRILWRFAEDGISYAEIRLAMNQAFTIQNDDGTRNFGHGEMIQMLADVLKEEVPKIQAAGHTFYGVKLIYACLRSATKEAMRWCMDTCIEMKQQFPDLICAFDLQGQEDAGQTLAHWIPELLEMRAKIKTLGLDLPFIFHAGETLDHGGDTDSNLFDAILLGTKRIGHGFSLVKHPLLMQLCKERNIAIETCPISNEVLGLLTTQDLGGRASVLSHDFYQALMGTNNLSLLGLRVLAEWSIEHSCMNSNMRERVAGDFSETWIRFCQWIIDIYGQE